MSRAGWNAAPPREPRQRRGALRLLVLHHTDVPCAGIDIDDEPAYTRAIQQQHFRRGFADIGYHFLVLPSGAVHLGRPPFALGAHVAGHNTGSLGIAVAGDFDVETPCASAVAALTLLVRHLRGEGTIPIVGHRELADKNCPGRNLEAVLTSLRSE